MTYFQYTVDMLGIRADEAPARPGLSGSSVGTLISLFLTQRTRKAQYI